MLQSKAGIENREYKAQRSLLADVDSGKISQAELFANADELLKIRIRGMMPHAHKPVESKTARTPGAPVAEVPSQPDDTGPGVAAPMSS
jgi:hypothetical protein